MQEPEKAQHKQIKSLVKHLKQALKSVVYSVVRDYA